MAFITRKELIKEFTSYNDKTTYPKRKARTPAQIEQICAYYGINSRKFSDFECATNVPVKELTKNGEFARVLAKQKLRNFCIGGEGQYFAKQFRNNLNNLMAIASRIRSQSVNMKHLKYTYDKLEIMVISENEFTLTYKPENDNVARVFNQALEVLGDNIHQIKAIYSRELNIIDPVKNKGHIAIQARVSVGKKVPAPWWHKDSEYYQNLKKENAMFEGNITATPVGNAEVLSAYSTAPSIYTSATTKLEISNNLLPAEDYHYNQIKVTVDQLSVELDKAQAKLRDAQSVVTNLQLQYSKLFNAMNALKS
ncbi:thioredoxin [Escherichia phage moha]|uniref:Thioredoxin n=1 Tax=Escherichia phage moha TaxID=2696423 RepID=A0A6B9WQN3_9CAUD|nr:thioredoxin [Escherichia phage moha]